MHQTLTFTCDCIVNAALSATVVSSVAVDLPSTVDALAHASSGVRTAVGAEDASVLDGSAGFADGGTRFSSQFSREFTTALSKHGSSSASVTVDPG